MPELKPEDFVEGMRKVVRTVRYGPRELALAIAGCFLIGLSLALPDEVPVLPKSRLVWILWAGGGFLLALAAWLIWKKVVAPLPEGRPKPAAIKGPAPFGPHDAELFARLGRNEDLNRLRDWILDDQKPLLALMGESGVGKTSLLRAGLENHLKEDAVHVIYWEALPTNPEEGLLHAIQSRWGDPTTAPASFAKLASAVIRHKCVVVIDQVEQLSPERHPGIFEMLRQVVTANPPYAATLVVAFRREYLPVWRDFELGLPETAQRRLETLSLRRFLSEQAERVIAVLTEEGGVPIEQKVVKALVESIQFEGRVTPADIGISLLVLSEISGAGKNSAFTLEDFRDRGGQTGLLERYLEGLLEDFPEAERREIFQALLSLIDLDHDQRLAEGRTLQELEQSARPASPPRFEAVLRFLASGKARVLEEVPSPPPRYRLIHERLIPAIRRLTGAFLAEAEQASMVLERAYRIWSRDRKARYLLSGREIRQVLRFRRQLAWGIEADQKRDYLRLARQHRNHLWGLAATTLVVMTLGVYLYSEHRSQVVADRALLTSWRLPPDLLDHLDQLEHLVLPKGVTKLDWLKRAERLQSLEIADANWESLKGLPEGLRSLKVGYFRGNELPQLPEGLVSLAILETDYLGTMKLPERLHELTLSSYLDLLNMITANDLRRLDFRLDLEKGNPLTQKGNYYIVPKLDITRFKSLETANLTSSRDIMIGNLLLPDLISSLTLNRVCHANWQRLPAKLKSLSCSCEPEPEVLPQHLSRLALIYPKDVKVAGPLLQSLYLYISDTKPLKKLDASGITRLTLYVQGGWTETISLPPNLKNLKLVFHLGSHIEIPDLPAGLTELEVASAVHDLSFSSELPKHLRSLTFRGEGLPGGLPQLPESLVSLTYSGRLQGPPPSSLRSLDIAASDQDLRFLASLWALNRLRLQGQVTVIPGHLELLEHLDISDSDISLLKGLPPNLTSLILRPGQITSLQGLPKSVVSLTFREPPSIIDYLTQ